MCLPSPLAVGGAALGGVGSYLASSQQAANARRIQRAQEEAFQAEIARQRGFQGEAATAFTGALDRFRGPAQEQVFDDAAASRTGTLEGALPPAGEYTSVPGSTPQIVRDQMAQKIREAMDVLKRRAGTLGRLGAWDTRGFENSLTLNRSGGQLRDVASMAGGSANVLPIEQQSAAVNSYRAPGLVPDLLQAGGMLTGLAGMTGGADWDKWSRIFGGGGRNWIAPWKAGGF